MLIVIGLGNPGQEFDNTPHNIGFMVLDKFQKENNFPAFALSKKHKALTSRGDIESQKVILVKPQTFMNNSGEAVKELGSFFARKEPSSLLVVHDDLALPLGQLKVSQNRGAGGHKGVKSIIDHLKTKNFTRIRIGVQPADNMEMEKTRQKDGKDLVLRKFTEDDRTAIGQSLKMSIQVLKTIINDGSQEAMNKHN